MQKVVLKTALKTLLGVLIALILAFTIASLGFPRNMAKMFKEWGWYSFATGYYSLAYSYWDNTEDLASCAESSILAKNDSNIIKYCEKLLAREDFEEFSKKRAEELKIDDYNDYKKLIEVSLDAAKERKGITDKDSSFAVVFNDINLTAFHSRPKARNL